MSTLIEIKGLYCATGAGAVIFEGADAEFYEGEKVAVIGPLGSGKATLLKLLLGLDKPQKGVVYLFGNDIASLGRSELDRLRRNIGIVFENVSLISNLKVVENVMLPLQYHTDLPLNAIAEQAAHLLEAAGYRGDIWMLPGPLPSYTKKTVAFARAMALGPAIMLYDRLLEGLDEHQGLQLLKLVDEFHESKKDRLSIMIANDERDIKGMALDRILRIENRRIVDTGKRQ